MKKLVWIVLLALGIIPIVGWQLERVLNRVDRSVKLPMVHAKARKLHFSTPVVDCHNDTLLFERNFVRRSSIGHIDLPRAKIGGVNLLAFAVATLIPFGFNKDQTNSALPDVLRWFYATRFSPMTLMTPHERAVYQAGRLHRLIRASQGGLRPVSSRSDLDQIAGGSAIGALLGFEGAQAVGSKVENIELLFALGYRVAGLTHFHDNRYAHSAHGLSRGGLTPAGIQLVQRCNELNMLIDVAHLSPLGIDDVLRLSRSPVIASHTGIRGQIDNNRNLTNHHVQEIISGGGVVGIGFWAETCGSNRPEAIVDTIEYAVTHFGEDGVALGSDFDGTITPSFDISQLPVLTQIMLDRGWAETLIRKILGGNALRLLHEVLPP